MTVRKVPPSPPRGDEAYRQLAQAVNTIIDELQPFYVAPVQVGTFTVGQTYSVWPCDASTTAMTANLPPAAGHKGKRYTLKKIDGTANVVLVDGNASETIDGTITASLATQWDKVTVVSDGSKWFKV